MTSQFSIERVVVLLTPIFGAASAWLASWVANNVPGAPSLDASAIEGIAIAAFLGAAGIVAKWLHGRQIPEIAGLPPSPAYLALMRSEIAAYMNEHNEHDKPEALAAPVGPAQ